MGDAFLQANRYQQFNDHLGKAEKQLMFQFNLKCSIPIWHRLRVISEDLHAGLALARKLEGSLGNVPLAGHKMKEASL